jgi:hypothetical protein
VPDPGQPVARTSVSPRSVPSRKHTPIKRSRFRSPVSRHSTSRPSIRLLANPAAARPPGSSSSGAAIPWSLTGTLATSMVSASRTLVTGPVSLPMNGVRCRDAHRSEQHKGDNEARHCERGMFPISVWP